MYGLIGHMTATPGQRDALIDILIQGVAGMPGCLSYVVARDLKQAEGIWITEVWQDQASHQAALHLPSVQAAIQKGRALIASMDSHTETEPMGGFGLSTT